MQQVMLKFSERVTFSLRALYERFGYSQYKMSKFEEYDLYARNKDFLISDSVITFTDTNGKLMALKPDVTLSIVKNSKDDTDGVQKVYYNENVYRVAKGSHAFKEIMQIGLECLGNIDDYCICEVLTLAMQSLKAISPACILDVSHVGLLSEFIDSMGIPAEEKPRLFQYISEKNTHELRAALEGAGVRAEAINVLCTLANTSGTCKDVLPVLSPLLSHLPSWQSFEQVVCALPDDDMLRIDFSVVDNIHYYNGFVFKGFIDGLPTGVLSGGQYDKLMEKMKRKSRAIGFALYTDQLERLDTAVNAFDVDTVLLYEDGTPIQEIRRHVQSLTDAGQHVLAQRDIPATVRYKQLLKLSNGEVTVLENHA
ncbi:MAG: ATP phosphoribosyltransferase regulatory subunit [Clostridia bacterium]|nr:ATP phosphoribosyltransferase regulatory subunit [Clostridia bacterium]